MIEARHVAVRMETNPVSLLYQQLHSRYLQLRIHTNSREQILLNENHTFKGKMRSGSHLTHLRSSSVFALCFLLILSEQSGSKNGREIRGIHLMLVGMA